MTSLTQVAITARKSIRYIILFVVFLTIGRILFGFAVTTYLRIFPPGPPPPTVKFGKLPPISFPAGHEPVKLTFVLETATGTLPTNISTQAKVYFMPKLNPNLLALDNAKSKAQQLGYDDKEPIAESDSVYKFTFQNVPTIMRMNIITGTFSISYDLSADRSAISNRPPAAEVAAESFRDYLTSANSLPADLSGPMIPNYLKLESGSLAKVLALSEADVTKVNLFRKDYDKLPSLSADPKKANVWGIIGGIQQKGRQVIAAEYHYYPVDETQFSTYPIISPEEAYQRLQNGQSFIASMGQYKEGDSLKIRKIYLAYFDPDTPSDFFQPIYVFDSGENDPENSFIGYVSAVSPSYIIGN